LPDAAYGTSDDVRKYGELGSARPNIPKSTATVARRGLAAVDLVVAALYVLNHFDADRIGAIVTIQ